MCSISLWVLLLVVVGRCSVLLLNMRLLIIRCLCVLMVSVILLFVVIRGWVGFVVVMIIVSFGVFGVRILLMWKVGVCV